MYQDDLRQQNQVVQRRARVGARRSPRRAHRTRTPGRSSIRADDSSRATTSSCSASARQPAARSTRTAIDVAGAAPVATISYGYWTRRFHNDPSVIGRTICHRRHQDHDHRCDRAADSPVRSSARRRLCGCRSACKTRCSPISDCSTIASDWLLLLGRLKPGVTLLQAQQQIKQLPQQIIATHGDSRTGRRLPRSSASDTVFHLIRRARASRACATPSMRRCSR